MISLAEPMIDWEGEAEMQRLLDMLPDVKPHVDSQELLGDSVDSPDLELSAMWDMVLTSPTVAAF